MTTPIVQLKNIFVTYGAGAFKGGVGFNAVKDVSLEIGEGEIVWVSSME